MEYVSWAGAKSAMRYIDPVDPFVGERVIQIEELGRIE